MPDGQTLADGREQGTLGGGGSREEVGDEGGCKGGGESGGDEGGCKGGGESGGDDGGGGLGNSHWTACPAHGQPR